MIMKTERYSRPLTHRHFLACKDMSELAELIHFIAYTPHFLAQERQKEIDWLILRSNQIMPPEPSPISHELQFELFEHMTELATIMHTRMAEMNPINGKEK